MSEHVPMNTLPLFSRPEPTEAQKAERILHQLAERDRKWLDGLRLAMRRLYLFRLARHGEADAWVSADDARRLMQARSDLRPPAGVSNNALGALFREPGWKRVGYMRSTTTGSHANLLVKWIWEPEP